ncbi:hypothetical protein AwPolaro_02700 [Polaromonas sp.]|nr:hypothetical protein AwPolaro_02700 [Polaromonas sp.]
MSRIHADKPVVMAIPKNTTVKIKAAAKLVMNNKSTSIKITEINLVRAIVFSLAMVSNTVQPDQMAGPASGNMT